MYLSRSTGELCPLIVSVECSSVVRLNTCGAKRAVAKTSPGVGQHQPAIPRTLAVPSPCHPRALPGRGGLNPSPARLEPEAAAAE